MDKKTKRIIIVILILLLLIFIFYKLSSNNKNKLGNSTDNGVGNENMSENKYILEGYPQESVPLYKHTRIESNIFYVNVDGTYYGYFKDNGEAGINYYNVVFKTTANQEDFISYYKSLMSEVLEEYSTDSQVYGMLAGYEVSIAHRGGDTGYLQVYLPSFNQENPYLTDYPSDMVDINTNLVEQENSYGKLNQLGGQIQYTKYFVLKEDYDKELDKEEPFSDLYDIYLEKYSDQENFSSDNEDKVLKWKDGEHEITLNFYEDHG
jgi:hypothetical protein